MSYVVDGNAIGGDLFAAFGREMTNVVGRCRNCRHTSLVAELRVYLRAAGAVARCPECHEVVMVVIATRDGCRVRLPALALAPFPPVRML